MPRQRKYVLIALVLQLALVLAGHYSGAVRGFSGLFGMGIPLVAGWLYTIRRGLSLKEAVTGGVLIGAVGAIGGLLVAILLGDQPWSLLPLGALASTATGVIGAFLGRMLKSRSGQEQPGA